MIEIYSKDLSPTMLDELLHLKKYKNQLFKPKSKYLQ